ncbi:unnamed protein product [Ranitomeya imitator]|uniref:Endonuclease/exonuclease/phosphatase domain-containing protein n=1 Tax=Ranitomeya imitator TaxID=111125 RepID=A0ABN9MDJ7_9NEOB|nr:unnamed protein product [Ranitomeya imitator]
MSSVDDDETQVPESLQENQGAEVEDDMVDDVLQPQHCNFPFRFFSLNYAILHYQFFSLNTAILHCRFFSLNIAIFHGRFFSLNTAILHCRFFSLNTAILHCRFFSLNTAILHGRFFCLNTAILHCWLFTLNTTILHCIFFSLNTAIHCIVKQIYVLSSSFMVMKSGKRCESLLNYIGLTSRELKVRTREHVRDIRAARDIVDAEALASLKTLPKHFRSFHESDPSGLKIEDGEIQAVNIAMCRSKESVIERYWREDMNGGFSTTLGTALTVALSPAWHMDCTRTASVCVHSVRIYSPSNLQVAVIYRPPGPATAFIDQFSTWLLHFLSADTPTIIMGDFNIPIDTLQSTASKLLSLTSSFGLTQWSSAATHTDGHTLDLVFTRLCALSNFTTSPLPLSDHHLLTFSSLSSSPIIHIQQHAHPRRNLAHLDTHTLSDSILPLASISSLHDTDSAAAFYNATLASAIDTVAPLVHGRARRINRQPWHNNTTKKLRQVSRVAERRWKRTHSQDDFTVFKQATLAFKSALTSAKQAYFTTLVSSLSHNPKQLFKTFNSLLRPPLPPPTSLISAEDFAHTL